LNTETAGVILEESWNRSGDERMKAYLYTILQVNAKTMREVMEMRKEGKVTIDEVLEEFGLTTKWRDEGRVEGRVEGEKSAWDRMVTLLKLGYTVEQLEQMVPGGFPTSIHA
jgi:enolase